MIERIGSCITQDPILFFYSSFYNMLNLEWSTAVSKKFLEMDVKLQFICLYLISVYYTSLLF